MKSVVYVLALGSLCLTACGQSSGGGGNASSLDQFSGNVPNLSEEKEITQDDYYGYSQNGNCDYTKYDTSLLGKKFRVKWASKSADLTSVTIFTGTVTKATEKNFEMALNFDYQENSILPGVAVYESDGARKVCEMTTGQSGTSTSMSSQCKIDAQLTQPVKDYLAAHPEVAERSDSCTYSSRSSGAEKAVVKYSKGIVTLDGGRKINVMINRTEEVQDEKCGNGPVRQAKVTRVQVVSKEIKDHSGMVSCGANEVFSFHKFHRANGSDSIYLTQVLSAPAR